LPRSTTSTLFPYTTLFRSKVRTLSSGQRQKMNMVRGFVTDPEILFLDEPTLGLDVNASRVIRDYVMGWVRRQKGKTILLTTHYIDRKSTRLNSSHDQISYA